MGLVCEGVSKKQGDKVHVFIWSLKEEYFFSGSLDSARIDDSVDDGGLICLDLCCELILQSSVVGDIWWFLIEWYK